MAEKVCFDKRNCHYFAKPMAVPKQSDDVQLATLQYFGQWQWAPSRSMALPKQIGSCA
jgi:hypothetical protein